MLDFIPLVLSVKTKQAFFPEVAFGYGILLQQWGKRLMQPPPPHQGPSLQSGHDFGGILF